MAQFSQLMITNKGQALIAKVLEGVSGVSFTKVCTSSATYDFNELKDLTSLSEIEQTASISKITRTNNVTVSIEASFYNTELTTGYFVRAVGLYATDPDDGEILYAVSIEESGSCWMPPFNSITVSDIYLKLVTSVGNADNILIEVSSAATAMVWDIEALEEKISNSVPAGSVMPFYNVTLSDRHPIFWGKTEPDTGWLVCDGGDDLSGGTVPDLSNRFIMGATSSESAGSTGGSTTTSASSVSISGSVESTTLSESTMPSHRHLTRMSATGAVYPYNQSSTYIAWPTGSYTLSSGAYSDYTGSTGSHTHSFSVSSTETHTHTLTPPYYTLVYCVKLPQNKEGA